MRRFGILLLAGLWLAAFTGCRTQAQPPAVPAFGSGPLSAHHTQVKLLLSAGTAKPGDTIWAGVDLKMEPGWHTYWKNPGDAGMATEIKWQLPPGISAGETQWPLPEKFQSAGITTYGYENETMLLVPLTIETNFPTNPGPLDLKANVSWLECKDVCIPANQDVEAESNLGGETKTSTNAAVIEAWKSKAPKTNSIYSVSAWWKNSTNKDTRPLILQGSQIPKQFIPVDHFDFFPDAADNFEVQAATEEISKTGGFCLRKVVKKYSGDWPKTISGVLVMESLGRRQGIEVEFSIADQAPAGETISPEANTNVASAAGASENSPATGAPALPLMLLYAFIGGLILNIMPCVLPVIALKILGFVSEARSEPRRVRNLGLIYALGVLVSFLVLAGIAIGVNAAGHHAGWGMQFGSPVFIVCLTTLVLLVTLNLFGVFEVTPGGRVLNTAGQLASKHGAPGAFFNGLLATALATPCTAPFLAPALGFAFTQTASIVVLIFLSAGLGLAAPYVLLSCNPALLKFLPKPGAWMQKFKIAMGFPMLATVVWLFNVAADDYGARVFWLGVFLVIVALAAWIFGEFIQRGQKGKGVAFAIVLILLIGGYVYALKSQLHWRKMAAETIATSTLKPAENGIDWQQWSPTAVAQARAAGKPVLVDFTARWCVTCNAIVKPALESDAVAAKLKETGAVALLADYTRVPTEITDEISKFGGAGVPLVLVFPKNPEQPAIVLPQPSPLQLPSSYSETILDALDRATR
ncbi:MAG TPA: protein-disulfide reductase DsbD domain-containing protein [Candidatus Aquilonibacter sp.]|nr:protein-disulfide reductase DsbD domain-containing protein [Candidatus Aquilonibacter sp.]